ncbi:UNVERIFIED_CONTAM: putative serine/threonine-protein kinase PIX13 [Sesamum radiatum]|uniref:non-specific serine/threonine protein kinase n=1 Tax=Sesamum radiatum TaxID=300843 RepID=A0AAW2MUL6_SESRA
MRGVPPRRAYVTHPNLRIFSFSELKAATRNFRSDTVLGEGGFGKVYKGWLDDKSSARAAGNGSSVIAVKKLNSESMQGFQEWQSEVNFLGRLSHPNLVKLLGYCWEDKELLLVYEFMQKGSLENHLFGRGSAAQPLPWDIRLKILIGAARGLAFLHASDRKVIYRDFKASNILLDGSYHAKISDFGLAKMGPTASRSHVTTQVMGTYGYAAPEYVATGHLYVKSDVYGFGVVLVEMLTGLRALDTNRPSGQHNLVDWIKPRLSDRRKLKNIMDLRLEGRYPSKSVLQIAQLALNCLENEPKNRPSMQEIVETLERIDSANERPRERRVHSSYQTVNHRHGQQPLPLQYRSPLHPRQEGTESCFPGQDVTYICSDQSNISSTARPDGKEIDIMVTYSDPSGAVQVRSVRSRDLSASWVWKSPGEGKRDQSRSSLSQIVDDPFQPKRSSRNTGEDFNNDHQSGDETSEAQTTPVHPVKLKRQRLRRERRERRTADLIKQDKEMDNQMQEAAIEQARELDTTIRGKYSIWRKEYENPNSDSTVKLMRDQIIMAKAYAAIAKSKNETVLYDSLIKHSRESQLAIGEAITDAELHPRPLHCIPLVLTTDYYLYNYEEKDFPNKEKLEDTSLYHYAIFSDNVLATSVVVNSTVLHAKEPEKHVFHIVTDKLNFAAMRMWFLVNGPAGATIQVQNVDEFTWLNSSYCPVLRQLESARMIEYYFKAHQTSSLTAGSDNLKYRNPKYLSMLNHLRFYLLKYTQSWIRYCFWMTTLLFRRI